MSQRRNPQPELGKAIHDIRKGRRLSQERVALDADLHPTWLSHIERGATNPTWGTVRRIAAALGVTVAVLAAEAERQEKRR